jgi:hypothetical protein
MLTQGVKVTDEEWAAVSLKPEKFHGEVELLDSTKYRLTGTPILS